MCNMPGHIVYVDQSVRSKIYTNNPFPSGIVYEQYARKAEGPILDYKQNNKVC